MYDQIIQNLKTQIKSSEFDKIVNKSIHLGVFTEPYLSYMLEGKKTIESRFSKNKILPYNQINKEDIVLIKKSGGDIVGYMTIKDVLFFSLKDTTIEEIRNKYQNGILANDEFWNLKKDANYATLIFIDKIYNLKPFHINKKGMQTWIKLTKGGV